MSFWSVASLIMTSAQANRALRSTSSGASSVANDARDERREAPREPPKDDSTLVLSACVSSGTGRRTL
eukprot:scaffold149_cov315-Pinguiococcus_pyrenoidosus.AAC.137